MSSVGAVDTYLAKTSNDLRWTNTTAEKYRKAYGFKKATSDWNVLVKDPAVEAIVIATPQTEHRDIALAAFAEGKPVFCENLWDLLWKMLNNDRRRRGKWAAKYGRF